MIVFLLQGLTLGLSASATPGALQFFLISRAMTDGWRRALPAAAAPIGSDIIIGPLVLLVLTRLPQVALNVIQVVGALVILFLAWGAYRAWRSGQIVDREKAAHSEAAHQSFLQATAVSFLNPNPYISWSTIMGPIVLRAWADTPVFAVAFIVGFYVAMVGLNATIIILFGRAGDLGPKVARTVLGIAALALALLGLYQLWMGIGRFMQTN